MSIITSAKAVMFYWEFVFLFVCQQLHMKTTDQLFTQLYLWTRKN